MIKDSLNKEAGLGLELSKFDKNTKILGVVLGYNEDGNWYSLCMMDDSGKIRSTEHPKIQLRITHYWVLPWQPEHL